MSRFDGLPNNQEVTFPPIGSTVEWPMRGDPIDTNWLLCDGRPLSRVTYATLFAQMVPNLTAVTVTIATPAVFTLANHGLQVGDAVFFTTTGALPTGLTVNTIYYVSNVPTASTFRVSATITAAGPGADVNTSGSQSGVHTAWFCPYGLGDGSTTFNIPDYRGRFGLVRDNMGTAMGAAGRLPNTQKALGRSESGEERHALITAELAAHTHTWQLDTTGNPTGGSVATSGAGGGTSENTGSAGSGTAHNNIPPHLVVNKIIRVL